MPRSPEYIDREINQAKEFLRMAIIDNGEVSPNGLILRLKDINRVVDSELLQAVSQPITKWLKNILGNINYDKTRLAVVEGSGDYLAAHIGNTMRLKIITFKKGGPSETMFGQIITGQIESPNRIHGPQIISAEAKDLQKNVIIIDDFIRGGRTVNKAAQMVTDAGGRVIAVCAAIARSQARESGILKTCFFLPIIEIDDMIPGTSTEKAKIKFAGETSYRELQRSWGQD
ncbi:MAG: phosphoribosyltransferase [Candidatus Gottesmanbacteria bacterium]